MVPYKWIPDKPDKALRLWSYGAGFFTMCLAFPPHYFQYNSSTRTLVASERIFMRLMDDNKSIIDFEARAAVYESK